MYILAYINYQHGSKSGMQLEQQQRVCGCNPKTNCYTVSTYVGNRLVCPGDYSVQATPRTELISRSYM